MTNGVKTSEAEPASDATLIIVPRERFGVAVRALEAVIELTNDAVPVVYVDAGSPKVTADRLRKICDQHGYQYIRKDEFLTPNQARNLGAAHAQTELLIFLDNDVIVSEGWIEQLVKCAQETKAEAVAPLTCQREPLHNEIHQAGGQIFEDLPAFFDAESENPSLVDKHLHQGETVEDVGHERREVQCFEFHCVLIRKSTFERLGPFDEGLLSSKEHLDFSLSIWKNGGRILLEPRAIVTYLFPDRSNPLNASDWPYFVLRWSPQWQKKSLNHFAKKWGLESDRYFADRQHIAEWRYKEGIAKPILRKIPYLGNKYKFQSVGQSALMPFIRAWGHNAVRKHAKQLD